MRTHRSSPQRGPRPPKPGRKSARRARHEQKWEAILDRAPIWVAKLKVGASLGPSLADWKLADLQVEIDRRMAESQRDDEDEEEEINYWLSPDTASMGLSMPAHFTSQSRSLRAKTPQV